MQFHEKKLFIWFHEFFYPLFTYILTLPSYSILREINYFFRYEEPAWPHGLSKRVLSDPAIHQENDDLYVNLKDNLSLHSRQNSLATSHHNLMRSQQSLMKSHNSLMRSSPQRGATIHDPPTTPQKQLVLPFPASASLPHNSMNNIHDDTTSSTCSSPSKNGTLRKRPVPTPRTILNTAVPSSTSSEMIASKCYHKIDKLIRYI